MTSKTQQSTSQQTSTPINQAALQSIYGQVANAAQTPYTPYGGELTAGINGQQTAGINTINQGANAAQPYYAQAGQLASGAANPLTAAQIAQYQNPYTQSVVNATQAQFNDQNGQQQNSLKGTAAQQGALGGDRQAVAQSQLAGQQQLSQAPVIAGLYANSYNSGLQTAAQQYQQNPLAAASSLAGIGSGAQNAALAGGNAQLQAGTLQQQTQQAGDTAQYQQYLAQQANPYQNAAFLEQYGLPSALAQGSTSSGTQTSPGPNPLAQYGGLGVAAAGLFLKDGGRVGFYTGGAPGYVNSKDGYIDSGAGYIPAGQASQNTLQAPQLQFAKPQQAAANPLTGTGSGSLGSLGSSLKNDFGSASFGGGSMMSGDAWGGDKSNPLDGLSAGDYEYSAGGLVDAIHHIHKTIKRSRGGAVTNPFQAYADGGTADDPGIAERWSRKMSNGRDQGQRALYNATRNGVYSSETRPEHADPGSIFSGLSDMRKFDSMDAQRIEDKVRGFADGGDTTFDDRFSSAVDNPFGNLSRGQAISLLDQSRAGTSAPRSIGGDDPVAPANPPVVNPDTPFRLDPAATQEWRAGVDKPNPAVVADSGMPNAEGTAPNPMISPQGAGLPPQITNPDSDPDADPSSAMAYDGSNPMKTPMGANGMPTVIAPVEKPAAQQQFGHSLFGANISDKTRQALVAAGLGMMASRSPFALSALGEGGLQGLKSYSESNKAEQEAQDKAVSQANEQQRIAMQGKQLALAIENQRRTTASASLIQGPDGKMMPNPAYLAEKKAEADANTKDSFTPIGSVVSADGTTHPLVMNKSDGKIIDAVTQKPPTDADKIQTGKGADPAVVEHLAHGIMSGEQPPTLTGLYGKSGDVRAKLDEKGFDLAKAQLEYKQAEKQIATLNGPQMTRFVGLAKSVDSTIDEVRNLSKEMDNSGIPKLNAAKLAIYMQAEGNSEKGQLAARYIGAVNTLKEEFANLANGGYAPTEAAWELANKQINGDYGVKQLGSSLDEVQRLIRYRVQAIPGLNTMGPGAGNRYTGQQAAPPATGAPAAPPPPPTGIPAGSAYSPSRKQWRDPSGQIYNADGSKV